MTQRLYLVLAIFIPLAAGCAAKPAPARVVELGEPQSVSWSVADWTLTLNRVVIGSELDVGRLLQEHQPLDRFLALAAHVGPQTSPQQFPDRNARLAYLVNVHNAAVLLSVMNLARDGALPKRLPADLASRFAFTIDGRAQRPVDLQRQALSAAGDDWRVHFVLCDARRDGPPLPARPFLAELFEAQLEQTVRSALQQPQIVNVNHEERLLHVWRGLYELRAQIVAQHRRQWHTDRAELLSALLAKSDPPRRELLNTAIGYPVEMSPANDELNTPRPPASPGLQESFARLKVPEFAKP